MIEQNGHHILIQQVIFHKNLQKQCWGRFSCRVLLLIYQSWPVHNSFLRWYSTFCNVSIPFQTIPSFLSTPSLNIHWNQNLVRVSIKISLSLLPQKSIWTDLENQVHIFRNSIEILWYLIGRTAIAFCVFSKLLIL